jgi:isopenicillin N synthase-like dioxygenase
MQQMSGDHAPNEALGPRKASVAEVPVLDLSPLNAGDDFRCLAGQLKAACEDTAFFYIANHGVSAEIIGNALSAARRFFEAPASVRDSVTRSSYNRGYLPIGTTQLPGQPPDLKDSFDIAVDLPLDDPDVAAGLPFHGPNQWPDFPGFREPIEAYFDAIRSLGRRLLRVFAVALDLEEGFFVRLYEKPTMSMRFLHYPRPPEGGKASVVGSAAHTDYGVLTILYQDPAGGLELQKPDGEWIAAPFIPDTFVVNIGDLMARWTNDRFRSNFHRVINRTGRERYSIAAFLNPAYRTVVECLPTCARPENPAKYPPIGAGDYVAQKIRANQYKRVATDTDGTPPAAGA